MRFFARGLCNALLKQDRWLGVFIALTAVQILIPAGIRVGERASSGGFEERTRLFLSSAAPRLERASCEFYLRGS